MSEQNRVLVVDDDEAIRKLIAAILRRRSFHVDTVANGDSGLLGMALRDDHTAAVHYTTPAVTADVVSLETLRLGLRSDTVERFALGGAD